jgi:hypothetical protein
VSGRTLAVRRDGGPLRCLWLPDRRPRGRRHGVELELGFPRTGAGLRVGESVAAAAPGDAGRDACATGNATAVERGGANPEILRVAKAAKAPEGALRIEIPANFATALARLPRLVR